MCMRLALFSRLSVMTFYNRCRRIRDQLLQDDRFKLAMEISTKCNLDTLSVWASWGMAWLRIGDFEKAREKLRHCFLVLKSEFSTEVYSICLFSHLFKPLALHKILRCCQELSRLSNRPHWRRYTTHKMSGQLLLIPLQCYLKYVHT